MNGVLSTVSCPNCRAALRERLDSWSCALCQVVFPMDFWWARDGELFPVRRSNSEPSSSSTSRP
jgi:hypothetical protein